MSTFTLTLGDFNSNYTTISFYQLNNNVTEFKLSITRKARLKIVKDMSPAMQSYVDVGFFF